MGEPRGQKELQIHKQPQPMPTGDAAIPHQLDLARSQSKRLVTHVCRVPSVNARVGLGLGSAREGDRPERRTPSRGRAHFGWARVGSSAHGQSENTQHKHNT